MAQPILIAAGGGGASDIGGSNQDNYAKANARGFLPEDLTFEQLVDMVPKTIFDAGKTNFI